METLKKNKFFFSKKNNFGVLFPSLFAFCCLFYFSFSRETVWIWSRFSEFDVGHVPAVAWVTQQQQAFRQSPKLRERTGNNMQNRSGIGGETRHQKLLIQLTRVMYCRSRQSLGNKCAQGDPGHPNKRRQPLRFCDSPGPR